MTPDEVNKLKVDELKVELKNRNVSFGSKDKKVDLIKALLNALSSANNEDSIPVEELDAQSNKIPTAELSVSVIDVVQNETVAMQLNETTSESTNIITMNESIKEESIKEEKEKEIVIDNSIEIIKENFVITTQSEVVSENKKPTSESDIEDGPTTVRIDHFVRPVQPGPLRIWLEDKVGGPLLDNGLWISVPLRTHGYFDFPTKALALRCVEKVTGMSYSSTTGPKLVVSLTSVTAADASAGAAEAKLGPKEYVESKLPTTSTSAPATIISAPSSSSSSLTSHPAPKHAQIADNATSRGGILNRISAPKETGGKRDRESTVDADSEIPARKRIFDDAQKVAAEAELEGMSLDELFKKTIATPQLYWLPCSKELVSRREEQARNGRPYGRTKVVGETGREPDALTRRHPQHGRSRRERRDRNRHKNRGQDGDRSRDMGVARGSDRDGDRDRNRDRDQNRDRRESRDRGQSRGNPDLSMYGPSRGSGFNSNRDRNQSPQRGFMRDDNLGKYGPR